jgi:hypothetical protein
MDIEQRAALKMVHKNISGTDYLLVESGGFGPKNPLGWQSLISVYKKAN